MVALVQLSRVPNLGILGIVGLESKTVQGGYGYLSRILARIGFSLLEGGFSAIGHTGRHTAPKMAGRIGGGTSTFRSVVLGHSDHVLTSQCFILRDST